MSERQLDLIAQIALFATIMRGEPEDVEHNAIVAWRQAQAFMKHRPQPGTLNPDLAPHQPNGGEDE